MNHATLLLILDKLGGLAPLKGFGARRLRSLHRFWRETRGDASRTVAAALAAAAIATSVVAAHEGYNPKVYRDPAPGAHATVCWGHRISAPIGASFTERQCMAFLSEDLARHGAEIAACLPADLPTDARAAFTSFAFNIGAAKFCRSTLAKSAQAGDLAGACAQLDRWVYAGGMYLRGLEARRLAERALCEAGLRT